jgi:hypothetical protein
VDIPVIERAKIQAQVLVPLVKALQAELGKERANALVRRALGDVYRRLGEQWWRTKQSWHIGENMTLAFASFAKGHALDYSVRGQSEDTFEVDVTGCRYAEFYKERGLAAMSLSDLGRVKTKSNLVVALSGGGIFAFFCSGRDHKPQNSGCGYTA